MEIKESVTKQCKHLLLYVIFKIVKQVDIFNSNSERDWQRISKSIHVSSQSSTQWVLWRKITVVSGRLTREY